MKQRKTKEGRAARAGVPATRRRAETLQKFAVAMAALATIDGAANRAIRISRKEARRRVAKRAKKMNLPVPQMCFE